MYGKTKSRCVEYPVDIIIELRNTKVRLCSLYVKGHRTRKSSVSLSCEKNVYTNIISRGVSFTIHTFLLYRDRIILNN